MFLQPRSRRRALRAFLIAVIARGVLPVCGPPRGIAHCHVLEAMHSVLYP